MSDTPPNNARGRTTGPGQTIWGVVLSLALITQLVGWLGRKPGLMLSNLIDGRIHQGVVAIVFMLGFWIIWHWGIGRKLPAGWPDAVFIAAGLLYWFLSLRYPIQP